MIDYLEGRDRPYKDSKERSLVEKMAKTHAVQDGILVTRKPYEEDKSERLLAVVPNGVRTLIISDNHDTPEGAHRDSDTTLSYIRRFCYWDGMSVDVSKFVSSCILCAISRPGGRGKGVMVGWGIEPPRLACVHADYCGPFQTTRRGNRYLFAIVDRATGWLELTATVDAKAELPLMSC